MAKFDIEEFVKSYKEKYDKLPDEATEGIGPLRKPAKKTSPDDKEIRKRIESVLKDNIDNSACTSCPRQFKCNRINWKGDLNWIKVIGCSKHPDQKKFKGHSTTVVITDSTVSAKTQNNDASAWASCRTASSASQSPLTDYIGGYTYKTAPTTFIISRGCLYHNTTAIPPNAIISNGKYQLYIEAIYDDNGSADNMNISKGNTAPHSPVVQADYDYTKYAYNSTCAVLHRGDLSLNAYNDFILTNLAVIVKAGYSLGLITYSDDPDNVVPSVADTFYGATPTGSSGANPPKLSVTYDLPVAVPPRSLNKKQMVI